MHLDERPRGGAIHRARADLARGDRASARLRLKNYLVDRPTDLEARRLLAEAYRMDSYLDAAGQWSYLQISTLSDEEREAFERSCRNRRGPDQVATSTLAALRWPATMNAGSDEANQLLRALAATAADERAKRELARNPAPFRIAQRAAKHRRLARRRSAGKAQRSR